MENFATSASTSIGSLPSRRYGKQRNDGGSITTARGHTARLAILRRRSSPPKERSARQSRANNPTSDCHNPWYEERGQVTGASHGSGRRKGGSEASAGGGRS